MTDREGSSQNEAPVFDPQKSSEPLMGLLSCCAKYLLLCWISYWPAWTNSWTSEGLKWDLERCAAVAFPSGSLEIYFMVIIFCLCVCILSRASDFYLFGLVLCRKVCFKVVFYIFNNLIFQRLSCHCGELFSTSAESAEIKFYKSSFVCQTGAVLIL